MFSLAREKTRLRPGRLQGVLVMSLKPVMFFAGAFATLVAVTPPAAAGNMGGHTTGGFGIPSGPSCKTGVSIYKPVTINKNVNIYKPVNIDKNINIYKPVTINKNINIVKNIDNSKNININKNIDNSKNININKNVNINKNIVINKGGGGGTGTAEAQAMAEAFAQAMASANASVTVNNNVTSNSTSGSTSGANAGAGALAGAGTYYNSYSEMKIVNKGGGSTVVHAEQHCEMQYASVVKAIHAVCVSAGGEEFPASHMVPDTWISASYEGEIARCIPGAHIKVVIGEVVQSDQGMASDYDNGTSLECGANEALRHYKNGMLKCAPAVPVPDCTERTNLRRFGTGDMFFTFRAQVCVAQSARIDADVSGMSLDGGVGDE